MEVQQLNEPCQGSATHQAARHMLDKGGGVKFCLDKLYIWAGPAISMNDLSSSIDFLFLEVTFIIIISNYN